jgi:hypothetical protein
MFIRFVLVCLLAVGFSTLPSITSNNPAEAASKTKKKRSDYTPDQRRKFRDEAIKLCRKRYGSLSTVYRIDYGKRRVVCLIV